MPRSSPMLVGGLEDFCMTFHEKLGISSNPNRRTHIFHIFQRGRSTQPPTSYVCCSNHHFPLGNMPFFYWDQLLQGDVLENSTEAEPGSCQKRCQSVAACAHWSYVTGQHQDFISPVAGNILIHIYIIYLIYIYIKYNIYIYVYIRLGKL